MHQEPQRVPGRMNRLGGFFRPGRAVMLGVAVVLALLATQLRSGHTSRAASLTAGGYTTSATVTPSSVAPGAVAAITATVTSSAATTVLVDVEVYSPAGAKVGQQYFDNQAFAAGQTQSYPVSWTVPLTEPTGTHTVKIGIFSPGWGTLFHWNDAAASFSVASATGGSTATPTPTATATATPLPSGTLPPLPAGWPTTLQIGRADGPGGAAAMRASAPFGFRYQYLAGGANTGSGWATWNANGDFVTYYIQDSVAHSVTPVFIYYQLLQSNPHVGSGEGAQDYSNLQNTSTMTAYFQDVKLFFQKAGAFPQTLVIMDAEPDFWGFMQQQATGDNAATIPAQVASTGLPELAGLPNDLTGFARAVLKLRDTYAPNVRVSYELSIWGTGTDIVLSNPPDSTVTALADRSAAFYRSLGAGFDLTSTDPSDRDAAFKQAVYGDGGAGWWDSGDYHRHALYVGEFVRQTGKRLMEWQIPLGNTTMLAQNNTWDHYQDNHVQTWLAPDRIELTNLLNAGVIALLFGRGADGVTCDCDAAGDGVTNPAPIDGNTGVSLSADDDGGYFRQQAGAYYQAGALALPTGSGSGTPTPTPTATATRTATPTSTPTPTATVAATSSATPSPTPSPGSTPTPAPTPSATATVTATPTADTTPPTVTITRPAAGATLPGTGSVTIAASAADASGIAQIQLLVDGAVLKTCTSTTSCSAGWKVKSVVAGPHTITAVATDASPNRNTARTSITVTK